MHIAYCSESRNIRKEDDKMIGTFWIKIESSNNCDLTTPLSL